MEVFKYSLPLVRPLPLAGGGVLTERRGLLLHDPETGGWGDAAPLPGFSKESLEEVVDVAEKGGDASGLPSLRFARSCVEQKWSAPEATVSVNALWITSAESVNDLADRLAHWSAPVVKVKPGAEPDLEALQQVCKAVPEVRLRIDGNRQWTVPQVLRVIQSVPETHLDYVEEPFASGEDYEALWAREPVPIALDEVLLEPGGNRLAEHPNVVAYVVKPTLIGSADECRAWTDLAEQLGKSVVWSSCFESGVGVWQLARWAAGGAPAGLDPAAWLLKDLVSPRPLACEGRLKVPETLQVFPPFFPTET